MHSLTRLVGFGKWGGSHVRMTS